MTENPSLEARLAAIEPAYRSNGEAQVGRVLDRYGVPFFYEQPTLIYDRGRYEIWHPNFTLPDRNGLLVEYAGMMDVPENAADIERKREVYRGNGIHALFVYPSDLKQDEWPERLYARIEEAAKYSSVGWPDYGLGSAGEYARHR